MKIRTKLIVTMIPLVFLDVVLLSSIGLANFEKALQIQIINELKQTAIFIMDGISKQMFERLADLNFLSSNNVLSHSNFTLSQKMEYLRSMEKSFKAYSSISLYDKEGIKIGDTRNVYLGENASQQAFFRESIQEKFYYDTIPTESPLLQHSVIHFAAPFYNESKGVEGVVVTRIPVTKINDIFKEITTIKNVDSDGSTLKLDLITTNGTVIYSNHDRKSILQTMSGFRELISKDEQNSNNPLLNSTSVESRIYDNEIIVSIPQGGGHLDYKGSNWFLLVREDANIVFSNLQTIVNHFIVITALIISTSIFVIFLIARQITIPLTNLMEKAAEMGKGNYSSKIGIKSSDEVGKLASSFESMGKSIMDRTKEAENAIRELRIKEADLEKINKELVAADIAKEEFMSMVSHELKTPLVPVRGYVELLLRQKKIGELNEKQNKYVNIVYRNVVKLENLVNDVLDGYKINMRRFRINKNLVSVRNLISSVVSDIHSLTREKQITIQVDSKLSQEAAVMCDQKRIEQVFTNLIRNSIDFVPESNGKITITAELIQNETMVQFSVEDNGIGIAEDKIDNLFQKFYQVDTSLIRKHGGSGLGLAISKGIVEAHGGKLWIDKEYKQGATFRFTIPF